MKIAVLATDDQWKELMDATIRQHCTRMTGVKDVPTDTDAFLVLNEVDLFDFTQTSKPVLINAVCDTLQELNVPDNVCRINGWNSFLLRPTWEIAGNLIPSIQLVCQSLGKEIIAVPDEPGFIAARIISMIINEAYFTLEQNISSKQEIDIAMKTGTNYPYGPFEWASLIGLHSIFNLLQKLAGADKRYLPCALLKHESLT